MSTINIKPSVFGSTSREPFPREIWSTIRNSTGTNVSYNSTLGFDIQMWGGTDLYMKLERDVPFFPLAAIAGKLVTAAVFHFFGSIKADPAHISPSLAFVNAITLHNDSVVPADFSNILSTEIASSIAYADFTAAMHTRVFNSAGLTFLQAAADLGGVFKLGTRELTYDLGGSVPVWVYGADTYMEFTVNTDDPNCCFLEITYQKKRAAFMGDINIDQLIYRHSDRLGG